MIWVEQLLPIFTQGQSTLESTTASLKRHTISYVETHYSPKNEVKPSLLLVYYIAFTMGLFWGELLACVIPLILPDKHLPSD